MMYVLVLVFGFFALRLCLRMTVKEKLLIFDYSLAASIAVGSLIYLIHELAAA
jgi:hypothetical protein